MSPLYGVAFSAFFLEDDYLVVLEVTEYFCRHRCAVHFGCAYFYVAVVVNEEHVVETDAAALVAVKTVYIHFAVFFYFELMTCDFYDCVHLFVSVCLAKVVCPNMGTIS